MAKVLITGIAGFIGSNIAEKLLQENAEVRGIDDLSSGSLDNIAPFKNSVDLRIASICDKDELASVMEGVEYVFHEAAIPSVAISVNDPLGTNAPNLEGTLCVLEAARKAGVKRIIYAASSAAYGNDPTLPKVETMAPTPVSPYAVQKLASEYYAKSYTQVYGLETVCLRYFNIFGPKQDPGSEYSGVLARFISQMTQGIAPTIFGDGKTSRDFTHINNVVSANLLAARAPSFVSGNTYNVATGQAVTLLQAYETIRRITGYTGELHWKPERIGDVKHSLADISKIKSQLGYRVLVPFEVGLADTIEWYLANQPITA